MSGLLESKPSRPAALRALLAAPEPVLLPGCSDALGARLIEAAGFDGIYMTGFGTAATLLGRPDVGLLTLTEMVGNAARISAATARPVLADADTGYGNAINVIRTVQEYERAGVGGIHLEDQVAPKRCGHLEGKQVVPAEEFVAKIEAAVAARTDPDFVLVARTDARATSGVDEAIRRARLAFDAGADAAFVEALTSVEEIERVALELSDVPLVFNWVEGGRTPPVSYEQLQRFGFALVILPLTTLLVAARAVRDALATVRRAGTPLPVLGAQVPFEEVTELVGLGEVRDLEARFAAPRPLRSRGHHEEER